MLLSDNRVLVNHLDAENGCGYMANCWSSLGNVILATGILVYHECALCVQLFN